MLTRKVRRTARKDLTPLHLKSEKLSFNIYTPDVDKLLFLNAFVAFQCSFPPPFRLTSNTNIAAHDRLTIYFHAVLSKDFKFNPREDRVFIRAERIIGSWESNAGELFVSRYTNALLDF